MSTHGAIAWNIHGFTIGIYNHSDSYPAHLGRLVWHHAKNLGLSGFVTRLKQVGEWEEFEHGGVCEYCGKVAGQPRSIQVSNFTVKFDLETMQYLEPPDPEVKYHEHGNSAKDQFEPFKSALFIEWIYVLDPDFNSIEVWFSTSQYGLYRYRNKGFVTSDIIDKDGYTHILFCKLNLDEDVPNWDMIDAGAKALKEEMSRDL